MDEEPFPVAPLMIGVAGLAIVGAGLAFGLAAKANEDDFAGLPLGTPEEIDIAEDRFDTANTQALVANIGIGVGAAVFAFGAVWLGLELADDGDEGHARLSPEIAPGHVGLTLSGQFVAGRAMTRRARDVRVRRMGGARAVRARGVQRGSRREQGLQALHDERRLRVG